MIYATMIRIYQYCMNKKLHANNISMHISMDYYAKMPRDQSSSASRSAARAAPLKARAMHSTESAHNSDDSGSGDDPRQSGSVPNSF